MKIPHQAEMWLARAQFLELALPTISGDRYLAAQLIDIEHVTNFAAPIIEMEIFTPPGDIFDFCENRRGFLALVMQVFDRDAETPIDFVAWTRDRPGRLYRYFGYTDALGVDQLYTPAAYFVDKELVLHRIGISVDHATTVVQLAGIGSDGAR